MSRPEPAHPFSSNGLKAVSDAQTQSRHPALYIVFLAAIAAVPPLATDMYLAAMPTIAAQWGVPDSHVALSLVLWFAGFSLCLLVCGPLSDKYGRRPVLLAGLALFATASGACALATNVVQLIIFRILQGIGAAGPSSMCMAICRDRYAGPQRKQVLAYIGVILGLTPMIAPMIGAALLKFTNWRMIFVVQGSSALVTLLVSLRYRETAAERVSGPLLSLMGRYAVLLRNRRYLLANSAMGLLLGPFYGFIAFSSIVYIQIYQLSNQAFSLLFGFNAAMGMLGAFVCTRVTRFFSDTILLTACLIGCVVSAVGILAWGSWHYLAFAACMCVFTFFCGMSRPLSNNLILEQVRHDIGSASSFLVFYQFMVAAACMRLVTVSWARPILAFGLLAVLLPTVVLAFWPVLLRQLNVPPTAEPDLSCVTGQSE